MRYWLFLLLFLPFYSYAADLNGYTAQYECKSGGANCNVDVLTYVGRSCDVTIGTGTAWSNVNSATDTNSDGFIVVCVSNGNHTSKGTLTISSSGTSGARKVLRYTRTGDNDDEPWNQSSANQAYISALRFSGSASYWIIHRLTLKQQRTDAHIEIGSSSNNNIIFSRILTENLDPQNGDDISVYIHGTSDIVVQNSVMRNCKAVVDRTGHAFASESSTNVWVVNSELYNCGKQIGTIFSSHPGFISENNDIYVNDYTQSGTKSKARILLNINLQATQANPALYIQNRVWGHRPCDTSVACSQGGGDVAVGGGYDAPVDWILFQNNIVFDNTGGYLTVIGPSSSSQRNSFIGNIFWNIFQSSDDRDRPCIGWYSTGPSMTGMEMYLNTFINCKSGDAAEGGWIQRGGITNSDAKCNVIIDSLAATDSFGSGTVADYNVYYGTTTMSESNVKGNFSLNLESGWTLCTTLGCNSTQNTSSYNIGDIIRTSATPSSSCTSNSDQDCFLYRVTSKGVSGTVQAVRGPFSFYRKLKTGPEQIFIPYAKMSSSAVEASFCPSGFASTTNRGIDNSQP